MAEIFTVILVLYIFLNISGDFWRDNLLEPLLISYAIAVMLILFLSARLENRMAVWFRRIFPKVLVPIVVFQLIASTFILRETGVTHPRYFVILFGVFATCAGIIFSLSPVKMSGVAAALLIVFSIVSITPPIDAFTISRISQRQRLEAVLTQNGMLQNNTLIPNPAVSESDREKIVSSIEYLYQTNAIGNITWLPQSFDFYADFENVFGFNRYGTPGKGGRYISVFMAPGLPIDISGYNILAHASVDSSTAVQEIISQFDNGGENYTLLRTLRDGRAYFVLTQTEGEELIRFDTQEIFSRYNNFGAEKSILSEEQATFTAESDRAKMSIVIQNASINTDQVYFYADCYVMIAFK